MICESVLYEYANEVSKGKLVVRQPTREFERQLPDNFEGARQEIVNVLVSSILNTRKTQF